jgi:AraC-like DNA-binding protein
MDVRTRRLTTLDNVDLKDATFAGRSFPAHFHDTWSLGLLRHGIERMHVGGDSLIVTRGVVVVLPPGVVHAHGAFDDAPWRYQIAYVSPDVVAQRRRRLQLAGQAPPIPVILDDARLYRQLARVHEGDQNCADAALLAAIDLLQRDHARDAAREPTAAPAALLDAAAYIAAHAAAKLLVDELAARFRMPTGPFVRAFRRRHGLTPSAYQLVQRLNLARRLLAAGTPIAQAALDSGFYDQSHFVRYFKKYTGTTPSEYRRAQG